MDENGQTKDKAARKPRFGVLKRFRTDRRGSVAIEFSFLILPFTMLVFAVLESCLSFAAQQVMSNATDDIARNLRTGKLKSSDVSTASMRTLICDQIKILVSPSCPGLVFDLNVYSSFSAVPKTIKYMADGDIDTSGFTTVAGDALKIESLRIFYRWPVMTDLMRSYLSTLPNGNTLLYSTMTWRNEPFT